MIKISVIVPVHNSEGFLERCIQSIVNQTYKSLEIILVNDGSLDQSLEICNKHAKDDQRITVISQSNQGVSVARNTGLGIASGDYIGFVDSDDYIAEDMYENLIKAAIENDSDIIECGYYVVNSMENVVNKKLLREESAFNSQTCLKKYLLHDNTTNYNWNKLYRYEIIKNIQYPTYKYSEDYYFNIMALMNCQVQTTVHQAYYFYVQHSESATNQTFNESKFDMLKAGHDVLDKLKESHPVLSVYGVMYILNKIRSIYNELSLESSKEIAEYKRELIKLYNSLFDDWYFEIKQSEILNKQFVSFVLFRTTPFCYIKLSKIYNELILSKRRI